MRSPADMRRIFADEARKMSWSIKDVANLTGLNQDLIRGRGADANCNIDNIVGGAPGYLPVSPNGFAAPFYNPASTVLPRVGPNQPAFYPPTPGWPETPPPGSAPLYATPPSAPAPAPSAPPPAFGNGSASATPPASYPAVPPQYTPPQTPAAAPGYPPPQNVSGVPASAPPAQPQPGVNPAAYQQQQQPMPAMPQQRPVAPPPAWNK